MRKIFKYQLTGTETETLEIPANSVFLSAQLQGRIMCLWFLVYPNEAEVKRTFHIIGTGWDFNLDDFNYLATIQKDGFVWHLFETKAS